MLLDSLQAQLAQNQTSIYSTAVVVLLYLSWRLWAFTISPYLHPNDPKPLPYWIPGFGHMYYFMRDPDELFKSGYRYFPRGQPFAVRLGTRKIIILTSIRDVVTVWKDTQALTFDPFVRQLMTLLGMSKQTQGILYKEEPEDLVIGEKQSTSLLINANPSKHPFYHAQMGWVKDQLSGNMLAEIGENFIGSINHSLHLHNFSSSFVESTSPDTKTVSLKKWARYSLVHSATKAFFGEAMMKVDPQFVFYYFAFEEAAWKMLYQYPKFLAQDLYGAAESILSTMSRFYDVPQSQRPDTVWMFKTIETEMRNLGLPSRDIATMTFMLFWGSNNNAHIICFWVIAQILTSPTLQASIREETAPAVRADGTLDLDHLTSKSPRLDAVWHEVLRLYTSTSLIRVAHRPTTVDGLTINIGDQVMSPFRQFHLNQENFGADAATWNPDRFLKSKELSRSRGYNPFGGGATYCPGRFLAKQEVYTFVAVVLHRFEVELVEPKLPTVNVREPCLGAMRPIGDISVKVREK
ncbi:MAG: hypothetical protein Q9216_001963 [Gyalolechia sp. 2 TL-2023]